MASQSYVNSKQPNIKGRHQMCAISSSTSIAENISIEKIRVFIEKKHVKIDECCPIALKIKTPSFKASARVRFPPLSSHEIWKLGWIQACTHMRFHNTYGNEGFSSWQFPALADGTASMVNDSDGSNYPFYGSRHEAVLIVGPQSHASLHRVRMTDNFTPHITWEAPILSYDPRLGRLVSEPAKLTHVLRDQAFVTWLAAMNLNTFEICVLRTYEWRVRVEIGVDMCRESGRRAWLVPNSGMTNRQDENGIDDENSCNEIVKQPRMLAQNLRIPTSVLYPANANSAQELMWYPSERVPMSPTRVISSTVLSCRRLSR